MYLIIDRFHAIFLRLKSRKIFRPRIFQNHLSPELQSTFQNLYLASTYLNLESPQRLTEIKKTINQILTIELKEKLTDLSSRIAQAENRSENTLIEKLETEYNQTLMKLSKVQSTKT